ncbi:E3 ubiquitin-protein ligase SINAT3-like isoform X2 [Hevea brasiliensis]|uniref:E3 ubiquitin-protein ligase SINAT3-like isoform X2 n=1 Tax=Hevea brasiliensis TaxID=3981 RepID=UPI0025FF4121|nr:E3 ubiquitin-protein ligase SINAT3-like isoform X2 [Hevea brasiliensis]
MGGGIPAPTSAVAIPKNYLTDEDVIDRYHLQFPSVPKPQSNNNTYNNSNSVSSATQSISVHELLECPVCNNSMYPPIYQVFHCFGQYFCLHFEAFQLWMALFIWHSFILFMGQECVITATAWRLGEIGGNSFGKLPHEALEIAT